MELYVFLFIICILILICVIRLLRPQVSIYERAFLIMLICAFAYGGYDKSVKDKLVVSQTNDDIDGIIVKVNDMLNDSNIHDSTSTIPFKKILASDKVLLKAILSLMNYTEFDKDTIYNVLNNLIKFFELYANILLDINNHTNTIQLLIDLRMTILDQMNSLYVTLPQTKRAKIFEYINIIIQSSTYKSLNVLKNKFGIHNYEPPLPENAVSFELNSSSIVV